MSTTLAANNAPWGQVDHDKLLQHLRKSGQNPALVITLEVCPFVTVLAIFPNKYKWKSEQRALEQFRKQGGGAVVLPGEYPKPFAVELMNHIVGKLRGGHVILLASDTLERRDRAKAEIEAVLELRAGRTVQ